MKSHFRTRAFLLCFLPFALLLATSFWAVQRFVQATVREGLHTSLRESQITIAAIHAKGDLQNSRFLKVAGENTALKAGIELLLTNPNNPAARRTVEDQLRELGEHMGFDFMLVSAPDGSPLAGVSRQLASHSQRGQLVPVDPTALEPGRSGFLVLAGQTIQFASVPVDVDDENIGRLSVGEFFELSDLTTPVVLIHNSKAVDSNLVGMSLSEIGLALSGCAANSECDFRMHGSNWISMPMQSYGDGYDLLNLQNVDQATAPIQARLHSLFITLALICVLIALLCSVGSSSSIVKPIAAVVENLRKAVSTGKLSELEPQSSSIVEIQELADIYNSAAVSLRIAGENLEGAYLEFVGSLASALDARDPYTAGHSHRVSHFACAIASTLDFTDDEVERVRIGALLHDIGKIGVSDHILQKPARLTEDEFALVRQHPVIGRRILEGVQGFAPYLGAVEFHHENWNGTGYPNGQREEETPIEARIIHVADAYDAMTTNRAYRRGMSHEKAISILLENAGIQFDPRLVAAFVALPTATYTAETREPAEPASIAKEALVG